MDVSYDVLESSLQKPLLGECITGGSHGDQVDAGLAKEVVVEGRMCKVLDIESTGSGNGARG